MAHADIAKSIGIEVASQAKQTTAGVGTALSHNAKSQAVNTRGTPDDTPKSSLFYNPSKTQEDEKFDLSQAFLMRARGLAQILSAVLLKKDILLEFVPKLVANAPLTSIPAMVLIAKDLSSALGKAIGEIGSARVLAKDLMINGFKMDRFTEQYGMQAKGVMVKAETFINHEAPVVFTTGTAINHSAITMVETADLKATIVKNEIHRVAQIYGLESDFLMALIKSAVAIKSGSIELDSMGNITLSAVGDITLQATNIKLKAIGSIDMGAAGSISAQTSNLTLHGLASASMMSTGVASVTGAVGCMPLGMFPVPPVRPDLMVPPIIIPPVITGLVEPDADVRDSEMVEQTQGMTPMGGSII